MGGAFKQGGPPTRPRVLGIKPVPFQELFCPEAALSSCGPLWPPNCLRPRGGERPALLREAGATNHISPGSQALAPAMPSCSLVPSSRTQASQLSASSQSHPSRTLAVPAAARSLPRARIPVRSSCDGFKGAVLAAGPLLPHPLGQTPRLQGGRVRGVGGLRFWGLSPAVGLVRLLGTGVLVSWARVFPKGRGALGRG